MPTTKNLRNTAAVIRKDMGLLVRRLQDLRAAANLNLANTGEDDDVEAAYRAFDAAAVALVVARDGLDLFFFSSAE